MLKGQTAILIVLLLYAAIYSTARFTGLGGEYPVALGVVLGLLAFGIVVYIGTSAQRAAVNDAREGRRIGGLAIFASGVAINSIVQVLNLAEPPKTTLEGLSLLLMLAGVGIQVVALSRGGESL